MIDLYGSGSPNVLKVLFMLGETGLPYTLHDVNVAEGEQFSPAFLALNPNGKVPVIIDRDGPAGPHTVFESGAILIYLAEKTQRLLPDDPLQRSDTLQWLMFQMANIGPAFGQALHFKFIAPPGNEYSQHRYGGEIPRLYDVVEQRLSVSEWLGGPEFSIADIATFPWVGKYVKTLDVDLSRRPAVARWIERIEAREGYRRIDELGKALFKKSLERQRNASAAGVRRFFRQA